MNIEQQHAWEGETFKGIHLADADLSGRNFEDCSFVGCEFIGCNFRNATFSECSFENCNLSNISLTQAKFGEVILIECKLVGLNFSSCKKLLFSIKLESCILQMCNFSGLKMNDLCFTKSEFKDCDFFEANLSSADLSYCNLKGTLFESCDLSEADFRYATAYSIDPNQNKLNKAKFSMPEVLTFLEPLGIEIE